MLDDDAAAEVGAAGEFEFEGRLYHWHLRRWCPRAAALSALFAIGWLPEGSQAFTAMLAESRRAAVVCGGRAAPHRFGIGQWRLAIDAAGGLSVADPVLRAARQQCHALSWEGDRSDNTALAAEVELAEVIRRLSGRLT
jgi:hypothetical protein